MRKQWSVGRTAAACAYSEQMYRNIESGSATPPIEKIPTLSTVLELDQLEVFRAWAREKLNQADSFPLLQKLVNLDAESSTKQSQHPGRQAIRELIDGLEATPFDTATARAAKRFIELLADYRGQLTAPCPRRHKELRIHTIPENAEEGELFWKPMRGKTHVDEHGVSELTSGIGHLVSFVRIHAQCGAFHQHLEGPHLDAGREFVCVVHGKGHAFFEHPARSDWVVSEVRCGTGGHYLGNLGHAYINTADEPLILFVVCVPPPPSLLDSSASPSKRAHGYAAGVEFRLGEVDRASIPIELKRAISKQLEELRHQTRDEGNKSAVDSHDDVARPTPGDSLSKVSRFEEKKALDQQHEEVAEGGQ